MIWPKISDMILIKINISNHLHLFLCLNHNPYNQAGQSIQPTNEISNGSGRMLLRKILLLKKWKRKKNKNIIIFIFVLNEIYRKKSQNYTVFIRELLMNLVWTVEEYLYIHSPFVPVQFSKVQHHCHHLHSKWNHHNQLHHLPRNHDQSKMLFKRRLSTSPACQARAYLVTQRESPSPG